jgi:hypothetical protein
MLGQPPPEEKEEGQQGPAGPQGTNPIDAQIAQGEQEFKKEELNIKTMLEIMKIAQKGEAEEHKVEIEKMKMDLARMKEENARMQAEADQSLRREQGFMQAALTNRGHDISESSNENSHEIAREGIKSRGNQR